MISTCRQQGVGELGRQRLVAGFAGELVVQEHVHDDQLLRLADQAEYFIEYLLLAYPFTRSVDQRAVVQQRQTLRRAQRCADREAVGQGFVGLKQGHQQPGQKHGQEDPEHAMGCPGAQAPGGRRGGSLIGFGCGSGHCRLLAVRAWDGSGAPAGLLQCG